MTDEFGVLREEVARAAAAANSAHASQFVRVGEWECLCGFVGNIPEMHAHQWSAVADAALGPVFSNAPRTVRVLADQPCAACGGSRYIDKGRHPECVEAWPEHLRDIAANLASAVRAEQKSVTDDDLRGLTTSDSHALIRHLGRVARDRPNEQRPAVHGLLRVTRLHPETVDGAATVLARIPADEIQPASVLIFKPEDVISFKSVLESWADTATSNPTKQAIAEALKETS